MKFCTVLNGNKIPGKEEAVDHDIIEFLAAKDERAVALMAERYEKLIRYIAVTILGDRSESVEECINDVYMKIWLKGHLYERGAADDFSGGSAGAEPDFAGAEEKR